MPLAANSLPSELAFSVVDYNREQSSTSVFLPAAASLTDIAVNVTAFETVLAALTDGFIRGASLSRRFNQTNDPPISGGHATSNVQRGGVFVFENSFGTFNTYRVPSISRALVLPGSSRIDVTAPAVAAYVGLMTTAALGVLPGVRPVGGNGYQLVRLVDAYEDSVSAPNSRRR